MKTTLTLLIFFTIFSINTFAQNPPDAVLEGHTDIIDRIKFSSDGRTLATGSRDGTIRLWDIKASRHLHTLEGHESSIRSIEFSPDGNTFASSGSKTIILWDVDTGRHLRTLEGHTDSVNVVAFGLEGRTLASTSNDDTIRLWSVDTGRHLHTLIPDTPVRRIAISPDGRILVGWGWNRFRGGGIHLWNTETGKHLNYIVPREINSVVFSPDGKILASASAGETIILSDIETGRHLHTLKGHLNEISGMMFSPDGRTLASISRDDTTRLWDVDTGRHLHTLEHTLEGGFIPSSNIIFSPDGNTLISKSGIAPFHLWDVEMGELRGTLKGYPRGVLSPDGSTFVNYFGGDIRLWKLPDTHVGITPDIVVSPIIGEQLSINVSIFGGENIAAYEVNVLYDATALRYVSSINGDYLPSGAFFVPPVVSKYVGHNNNNAVKLGATSLTGVSNGDGTLATVTFEVVNVKESVINTFDVILTDSTGAVLPHWINYQTKVTEPSQLTSPAVVNLTPASVMSSAIGEKMDFKINITEGQSITDYQMTLQYDRKALQFSLVTWSDYFNGYYSQYSFDASGLTLHTTSRGGAVNGAGTLATVTFEVIAVKPSTISISGHLVAPNGVRYIPTFENAKVILPTLGDVNRDGTVNILDLVLVGSSFGRRVRNDGNPADVNEDGLVNVVDLVIVAGAIGGTAAPSLHPQVLAAFTTSDVQQWLSQAQHAELNDAISQRGIRFLEQLLDALIPKETALLANYPNPFNPETWIPYQLAKDADVTLTIYAVNGHVVRRLALGHQPAGMYQNRSRAAYWDGRNAFGETVASGAYFYTLTAGDFTATRKMIIVK